jgi:hypothetical protein
VQHAALLVIHHRIAIAVQDQVRRRAGVDAVARASRSCKLGVVVDPVEPEQFRGPRRREDLGLERVAPPGKEKVADGAVGDDRAHRTGDAEVVAEIALELRVTGRQRVREARWPPAETPPIAIRFGSSPYPAAFARSHRTAAFTSWTGAGYLTDGTRR